MSHDLGSVIPGSTIILALSALVPGGELDIVGVFAAAIAGAALGDGTAFWIGHRSQREILSAWPMSRYPNVIAQSEAFFHRYGTLAVFFARFVAPIRAFVPVTAGALGMPPQRFYAINIAAIVFWIGREPWALFEVILPDRLGTRRPQRVDKRL